MAGGPKAVCRATEGAEDSVSAGLSVIGRLRPGNRDVVIGITASGTTPFVRGALTAARKRGARTIGITCNPASDLAASVDQIVALRTGPEAIAGSTRLKAGTATKIVLNILTTVAMVRIGKTYGNLMVDVKPGSAKLCDRARRILQTAAGIDQAAADRLLRRTGGDVKVGIVMQKAGVTRAAAQSRLKRAQGSVRRALGEP
jgi:N-acetylmuramic acid 6-phosphate etherase